MFDDRTLRRIIAEPTPGPLVAAGSDGAAGGLGVQCTAMPKASAGEGRLCTLSGSRLVVVGCWQPDPGGWRALPVELRRI